MLDIKLWTEVIVDGLLKSVLNRQIPYLVGGTITGTITDINMDFCLLL